MMKKLILVIFLFSCLPNAQSTQKQHIGWQDLKGKVAPYDDPFIMLSDDQFYHLSLYAQVTEMQDQAPERVNDNMIKQAAIAKQQLIKENIDLAYMLEQRTILIEKRRQAEIATNSALADISIIMSGYMLPLEFDNGLVSEFLLVPVIGACSHKPVPPANQLVLVKAQKPVKAGNPYMPITVSGILRITTQTQDLYLIDGSKQVEMAYTLEDTIVAPYQRLP